MKKLLSSLIATVMALTLSGTLHAQSIKDMIKKATTNEKLSDFVESITGMVISPKDITGTWNYSGAAIKLESDELAKKAAAVAAAGPIEKLMDEYLQKVGVKPGLFGFTFKSDKTFSTNYKGKFFKGTYAISEDGKTLTLTYGKILNSYSIKSNVNIGTDSIELLFKADNILDLIGKLSATSDNPSLKTLCSLTSQYDGLKIGMKMSK